MSNRIQSLVFWSGGVGHWAVTSYYAVVVECNLLNPEFNFACFDLDTRFIESGYQSFVDFEEFF